MNNRNIFFAFLMAACCVRFAYAQDTLQVKYNDLLDQTETYEIYKVIPQTQLNAFWAETMDSLRERSAVITELRDAQASQQQEINRLQTELGRAQSELDSSLAVNDAISFLGMEFSKTGYHIMVWLIIVVLALLSVVAYSMFIRSNSVTTRTRREYDSLQAEFETHKNHSREKQVKLKRELQTALNQLNERR